MGQRSRRGLPRSAAAPLATLLLACGAGGPPEPRRPAPVDRHATSETHALFVNLRLLAGKALLFGHQDDLAYGVRWFAEPGRSDVKETAGSYPAVYGWDVGGLEWDGGANLDSVAFGRQRDWIAEGYRRGGVITLSWHMRNPVTGGNAWDTTQAVRSILPGGTQ
ncbi:MAG: glycosyl transferase family 1, partial [Chloroflexi bacterium]